MSSTSHSSDMGKYIFDQCRTRLRIDIDEVNTAIGTTLRQIAESEVLTVDNFSLREKMNAIGAHEAWPYVPFYFLRALEEDLTDSMNPEEQEDEKTKQGMIRLSILSKVLLLQLLHREGLDKQLKELEDRF